MGRCLLIPRAYIAPQVSLFPPKSTGLRLTATELEAPALEKRQEKSSRFSRLEPNKVRLLRNCGSTEAQNSNQQFVSQQNVPYSVTDITH